mmetsp:Transcript_81279/g.230271  ORF Transcript_81279/g.230271 Transcript_81279/m.230271 type:complete len:248 (-) Transcript_81279:835-1578(-)
MMGRSHTTAQGPTLKTPETGHLMTPFLMSEYSWQALRLFQAPRFLSKARASARSAGVRCGGTPWELLVALGVGPVQSPLQPCQESLLWPRNVAWTRCSSVSSSQRSCSARVPDMPLEAQRSAVCCSAIQARCSATLMSLQAPLNRLCTYCSRSMHTALGQRSHVSLVYPSSLAPIACWYGRSLQGVLYAAGCSPSVHVARSQPSLCSFVWIPLGIVFQSQPLTLPCVRSSRVMHAVSASHASQDRGW